ncbi:MAG: hypothetical protein R3A52_13685 [Polyangiales bacterium]
MVTDSGDAKRQKSGATTVACDPVSLLEKSHTMGKKTECRRGPSRPVKSRG